MVDIIPDDNQIRKRAVAWRHQAITWNNVDWSSMKSIDIHNRAISQEMPQPSITKICLNYMSKISFKFPRGQWVNIIVLLWNLIGVCATETSDKL